MLKIENFIENQIVSYMKKESTQKSILKMILLQIVLLSLSFNLNAQGDVVAGKAIFNSNCTACHKLDAKVTGPALRGIAQTREKSWLVKWIKNSSELVASGDALAVKVYNENNKAAMPSFPQLSDKDIDDVLAYCSEPKPTPKVPAATASNGYSFTNSIALWLSMGILILLVIMLFVIRPLLKKLAEDNIDS